MEQLNIEGKRSGAGFVAHRESLVSALSRAQAPRVEIIEIELGRKGLLNYLRLLGGSNIVKIVPSNGDASGLRIADNFDRVGDYSRSFAESISIADNFGREVSYNRSFAENVSAADNLGIAAPWKPPPEIDETTIVITTITDEEPPEIDASDEADTEVSFSGTGTVSGTVFIGKYAVEPATPTISFSAGTGKTPVKFIEVHVSGFTTGVAHITIHYTDAEISGLAEDSLYLFYWDGSSWQSADNIVIDTAANTISGDIPVSALSGTPIGIGGEKVTTNWLLIIWGIIGGIVVIGSLYFLVIRRRQG